MKTNKFTKLMLAIRLGIFGTIVAVGAMQFYNFSKIQNNIIKREEIPDTLEKKLWLGTNKSDSITIKIDGKEYRNLVNEPRNCLSQKNFNKFIQNNGELDNIYNEIINSDLSNINRYLSIPEEDKSDLRVYIPSEIYNNDYARVLDFIQANVKYEKDSGFGYAKFPLETLVEGKGDCEDMAYLAATLLQKNRKIGVVFERNLKTAHATIAIERKENEKLPYIAIFNDKKYLEAAKIMMENGELKSDAPFWDSYEKPFNKPEVIIKKKYPYIIKREDIEYFLIETTGEGYDIKDKLEEDFSFHEVRN